MNRTLNISMFLFIAFMAFPAFAEVQVIEGDAAKKLYAEEGKDSQTLSQINKTFVLKSPGMEANDKATEVNVKVGESLFILNDEEKTVHNVYDATDHNWVLKKQLPSSVAAVKFKEPGAHDLRCAIHPGMKIKVKVDEGGAEKVQEKTSKKPE